MRNLRCGAINSDTTTEAMPIEMVSHPWRKVQASTRRYNFCTRSVKATLPSRRGLTTGMISTSRKGMTTTASTSETIRLMVTVQGKKFRKSRNMPDMVKSSG